MERGLSKNSREAYAHDVERFLEWCSEQGLNAVDVKLDDLHRYSWELFDIGILPRSIARNLAAIRSFYGFLLLDGYITQDPTELLATPSLIATAGLQIDKSGLWLATDEFCRICLFERDKYDKIEKWRKKNDFSR